VLSSGAPLVAEREGGVRAEGIDAACVNCHRRSGFGSKEGRIVIPPVASQYLLRSNSTDGQGQLPYVDSMRLDHDPQYTEETLARAIREGVDAEGKPLNYLMPRFDLNDTDMSALIDHLKQLNHQKSPGVSDTVLQFATIITPDADPVKRQAMLDVMNHYFAAKNLVRFAPSPRLRASSKTVFVNKMFMVNRRWELHIWQLTGSANTWEQQLKQHFAQEPVLAVISGLGGKNWQPVHMFCEHAALPCIFPNTEVPVDAEHDFYSLYFNKGVLLEAGLIAKRILEPTSGKVAKVVHQIYRAGDSGEAGAQALASLLKSHGISVVNHILATGQSAAEAQRAVSDVDAFVLWLRPTDISALGSAPTTSAAIFISGLMGGLERAPLPAGWRDRTNIAYPFDLPEKRRVPVDFARGWFSIQKIPVVAEQVQVDTYLACGLLAETLGHMADTFVPDYLVERIEDMLGHRILTGYYPRLSLAPGQRFASKGGYIVHFVGPTGIKLAADSGWIVP